MHIHQIDFILTNASNEEIKEVQNHSSISQEMEVYIHDIFLLFKKVSTQNMFESHMRKRIESTVLVPHILHLQEKPSKACH